MVLSIAKLVKLSIGCTMKGIVASPIIVGTNRNLPVPVLCGIINLLNLTALLIIKPGMATDARIYQTKQSAAVTITLYLLLSVLYIS